MPLRLDPIHGVNPSVSQCFVCMKEVGVVLFGRLKDGSRAPNKVCLGHNSEPCAACKRHMDEGIILISVDMSKTEDEQNPYRSGGWAVVTETFIRSTINPPALAGQICEKRMAFLPDEAWDLLGIDR